jgi:hypothetical protein
MKEPDDALAVLERLEINIDAEELQLILRAFPDVDCTLEAHRYVRRLQSNDRPPHPLYVLRDFESWLRKASPKPAKSGGERGALSDSEIERRVAHYRENIAGGEVFGEKYLEPRDVNWLCAEYEDKLRARR